MQIHRDYKFTLYDYMYLTIYYVHCTKSHIGIFDNMYLKASKCWQAPLDQIPESKILINIEVIKDKENKEDTFSLFYGWLFASAPSASGLEHPIYDVTAIKCL